LSREVPLCEGEISKEYYIEAKNFLEAFTLTPREALTMLEVFNSRGRHYIGADQVARKLSAYNFSEQEVTEIFKTLSSPPKNHLRIYPSKKEVLCCMPDDFGVDAAKIINEKCYSTIFPYFDTLREEYETDEARVHCNPMGWVAPMELTSRDKSGNELKIKIISLEATEDLYQASNEVYSALAKVELNCNRCGKKIECSFSFTDEDFWGYTFECECDQCNKYYRVYKDLRYYEND